MTQNKNIKIISKKKMLASILLVVLTLVMIAGGIAMCTTTVNAATNRAGTYAISGTYNIGDGNVSGYLSDFKIQISTKYYSADSSATTYYNNKIYNWTYFSFYIYATDIDSHTSFKLTRNGSTYVSKSLSGKDSMYLYQGELPDGDYVLTYVGAYWENMFVKKTYTFTYKFEVDTAAPVDTIKGGTSVISVGAYTNKALNYSISDANPDKIYYRSSKETTFTSTTATSKSVSATTANNGWWYFYAIDDVSNSTSILSVYLDTVAPVGKVTNSSGTIIANGGYTNKPIKYTATDTGGVSYYQVKTPGSSTWASYTSGTALSSATGWFTFRSVDKAGNTSSEYKVYYDATAPTGAIYGGTTLIGTSGSYTNASYVKYVASDTQSGVANCYVKKPGSSSYVAYTSGTQLTAEGTYLFYCVDKSQNQSSIVSVILDKTKPTGTLYGGSSTKASGSYTNQPVKFTATDAIGLNYLQIKLPGTSTWSSYSSGTALSSKTGWYTFRAVDKAGNVSSEYTIYYDATAPTGTLYGGTATKSSGAYTNASYVKYVASDANSGVANCYVKKPGSSSYVSYTSGTQLTAEGTYYFYCVDRSGSSSATVSITLDRTAPVGTLYGGTATKTSGSYTSASYVKYTASDSLSGVSTLYVKMPGASYFTTYASGTQLATEGTYQFYCIDKAQVKSTTVTITLDKTKPTGVLYAGNSTIATGDSTNASFVKFVPSDNIRLGSIYVKKPGASSFTAYTSGTQLTAEGTYQFYCTDLAQLRSDTYTVTLDRQTPSAQLYVDGKAVSKGAYTNGEYISFECDGKCYVKMPGATSFVEYVSGTEFNKAGKYVFYGISEADNSTGEYTIIIDRTVKQATISNVKNGTTSGDVVISWTNGNSNTYAPIRTVTVNGKSVGNGATVHTIDTASYTVKVVDAAGNSWETTFRSTKKNVLTDTLVKEFFEAPDINGDIFAFTTYDKALEFSVARENTKVKSAEWNNSTWDTGVPMDTVDAANAKNGTYFIYYKSGNPEELVAYFTTERLNEVIAEYAKADIKDYYYWEKQPAAAGPDENLYSYSKDRNILAKEVLLGNNIGITIDGKTFVGTLYNTEGKHTMVISDSYGNSCTYNLTIIRTVPDIFYAIGEGDAVKADLERIYYFKDGVTLSITDAFDEMAMFNVYDENGALLGSYSIGESCTLTESGTYSAQSVNHMGTSEKFNIVISRNAPKVDFKTDAEEKQLVITIVSSVDDESHFQTIELYKSTDAGNTWTLLEADDYGTAVELGTFVYMFRTSGMYKVVVTDEFRTGMDAVSGQITYTQPAPTGNLAGVENGGHTNKEVTFTWDDEAKVTVTKDGETIEYNSGDKLIADGKYNIVFENFDGSKSTYEFVIDTVIPEVAVEGHKADLPVNVPVTVNILENDASAVIIKNGIEAGKYISGTPIADEGEYIIRVTDKAQNVTEVSFEIDKSVEFDININDGGLANSVTVTPKEDVMIVLTKDGNAVEYTEGTAITAPGKYTVKVIDELDNTAEMSFIIVEPIVTSFSHSFDETDGFEKVIINGEETRLNYGALELTAAGTYEVGVVVDGKTYNFTVKVDNAVDFDVNVHDNGVANTVTINTEEDVTVVLTKDENVIDYNTGTEITAPGAYTAKITDSLGNVSEISFTVITPVTTSFKHSFEGVEGFEKVLVNGSETRLNYNVLELTKTGTYKVDVVVSGETFTFTVNVDSSVDFDINVHNNGFANSVKLTAKEALTVTLTKDGKAVTYKAGREITEPGKYTLKLVDGLKNETSMSFTIISPAVKSFSHSFAKTEGFEKLMINGKASNVNYGSLELTETGKYKVDVVISGKTYTFTVNVDNSVDYDINVHDQGFANSVKLTANENVTLTMTKNGEAFVYEMGTELTEAAAYTVKMVDALGNTAEMSFTIIPGMLAKFEAEIDEMPGFEKVLVNGEEVTLEKGTLLLNQTGAFEVSIIANGAEQKFTVNVDATAPTLTISGVENGGITKDAVILSDASEEATVKVMKGEEEIEYTLGDEIKEPGVYKVTVTDAMGNATEYNFEIEKGVNGGLIALFVILGLGLIGAGVFVILKKKKVF